MATNLKQMTQQFGEDIQTLASRIKKRVTRAEFDKELGEKAAELQALVTSAENKATAVETKVGDLSTVNGTPADVATALTELFTKITDVEGKQVTDAKITEVVENLLNSMPENLNSLLEVAQEVQKNGSGLQGLVTTIGTLSDLTTNEKSSLVGAVNEVKASADAATAASGEAKTTAAQAQETATAAQAASTSAQETATNAASKADEASNTSKQALDNATSAKEAAEDAQTKVNELSAIVDEFKDVDLLVVYTNARGDISETEASESA